MTMRLTVALVTFALWIAITIVGGNITTGGDQPLIEMVQSEIGWTWVVAWGFVLAVVLWQGWHDVALNRWAEAKAWRLSWLPMVYVVGAIALATYIGLPPATVLLIILVNTLLVGFSEELMLRGVILQAFRHSTEIWTAVLLTSILFGAMHSLNVFVTGDLKGALIQSAAAFLSGLVFIALRLRTGSLWPPIIVHALWDFATFTLGAAGHQAAHGALPTETVTPAAASGIAQFLPVVFVLPNAVYGLWLMRSIGRTHSNPAT